jgi:hypothetical protein
MSRETPNLFNIFNPHAASRGSSCALPHAQVDAALPQQIAHFLEVDLYEASSERELAGGGRGGDCVKYVNESSRSDTPSLAAVNVAHDCVGLAAASLTVGYNGAVETV